MPLPTWLRSFAKQLDNPKRRKDQLLRPRSCLRLELMEERLAPTITPVPNFAGNAVVFNGASTDNLHLKVAGGLLEWSADGVNFNSDVDPSKPGAQTFTVNSASQITSNLFGTLFIQGMTGGAGTYTATSSNIEIDNSISTEGSNLAFAATGTGANIAVAPASTPVVISTRDYCCWRRSGDSSVDRQFRRLVDDGHEYHLGDGDQLRCPLQPGNQPLYSWLDHPWRASRRWHWHRPRLQLSASSAHTHVHGYDYP